jgi:hypothetical protein
MSETYAQKSARLAAEQDRINGIAGWSDPIWLEQALRDALLDAVGQFPQYAEEITSPHWAIARAKRRVKSKGGVQFEAGDYFLIDTRPWSQRHPNLPDGAGYSCELPTAFSTRLGWHVAIRPTSYRIVQEAAAS